VNEFVGNIVNLAQIHEKNNIRFCSSLFPIAIHDIFAKSREVHCMCICNGHEVCLLLLGPHGNDGSISRAWGGYYTHATTYYPSICNALSHLIMCLGNDADKVDCIAFENRVLGEHLGLLEHKMRFGDGKVVYCIQTMTQRHGLTLLHLKTIILQCTNLIPCKVSPSLHHPHNGKIGQSSTHFFLLPFTQ
jgi:hypothetical protein